MEQNVQHLCKSLLYVRLYAHLIYHFVRLKLKLVWLENFTVQVFSLILDGSCQVGQSFDLACKDTKSVCVSPKIQKTQLYPCSVTNLLSYNMTYSLFVKEDPTESPLVPNFNYSLAVVIH